MNRRRTRLAGLAAGLAMSLLSLTACGQRAALQGDAGISGFVSQVRGRADRLPALPQDLSLPAAAIRARRGSAIGEIALLGDQVFNLEQSTAQTDSIEHSCLLSSNPGGYSWVIYAFSDLLPEDLPAALQLSTVGEEPAGLSYVAVANYAKQAWDWTTLSVGQQDYVLPVAAGGAALSANGTLYVVVATYDGVLLDVGRLKLQLDCPAPPPLGFATEPGDGTSVPVQLSWIDPALSFDPDGSGSGQFVYDGVLIQRALSAEGPWENLVQLQPGATSYSDQLSIGGNPPPEGGFYYHVMTLVSGATPFFGIDRFGGIDFALIQLEARLSISTSDGPGGAVHAAFDASSSVVEGGTLSAVKWDFEGDGKFDETSVATLTAVHDYAGSRLNYPRLMLVMDVGGGSSRVDTVSGFVPAHDLRGDWSQNGRNCQHTRCSPFRGPKSAALRGSYDAASTVLSPAIGSDGKVYVADGAGKLLILNADCSLDRTVDLLGGIGSSPPAITYDGYIWLNVDNGGVDKLRCVFPDFSVHSYPPPTMTGVPVVEADGHNMVAAAYGSIFQARPMPIDGFPDWYIALYLYGSSSTYTYTPAISRDNFLFVLGTNASVKLQPPFKAPPSYTLVASSSGIPLGGQEPVVSNAGFVYSTSILASRPFIYRGTSDCAWALDAKLDEGSLPLGGVAVAADGNVYASTEQGVVYAFPPALGTPFARYSLPSGGFASPPVIDADGRVYVLAKSGLVYCLSRKLAFKWSYDLGAPASVCELAIGNDGTLYVGGTSKLVGLH